MKASLPFIIPLVCVLAGCGGDKDTSGQTADTPDEAVTIQSAISESHIATEEVVGTVRSKQRAVIQAKVSGRIMKYVAVPGQMVKSGEVLAELDAQEILARRWPRSWPRSNRPTGSRALQTTHRHQGDQPAGFRRGGGPPEGGCGVAQRGGHHARLCTVTAPFDGVITRKLAEIGDLAMPGKPLMEIESPGSLRFEADLPEAMIDRVKLGDKMKVRIATLKQPLEGTASEISPIADASSRTFQVKFDLPAAAGLRSGQFGRVSIPMEETKVLQVPREAVMKRGQWRWCSSPATDAPRCDSSKPAAT
jgi:multidrug efflux pump subunit AcrA (membrane-fusion protein)